MPSTDTATITDVTLVAGAKRRHDDVFALTLSADGIEVRRPDQPSAHLSWSRVSQWQIEERASGLVLTLRGDGSTTPLAIRGWSLPDLDAVMRRFTGQPGQSAAGQTAAGMVAQSTTEGRSPSVHDLLGGAGPMETTHKSRSAKKTSAPTTPTGRVGAAPVRATRFTERLNPKVVVTMALLALFALAVTIVLLQSAGIITWSFLGPTS